MIDFCAQFGKTKRTEDRLVVFDVFVADLTKTARSLPVLRVCLSLFILLGCVLTGHCSHRLGGQVVRRPPREREARRINPRFSTVESCH